MTSVLKETGERHREKATRKQRQGCCSHQKWGEARKGPLLEPSQGVQHCGLLDSVLLASRTPGKYISAVLSHPVFYETQETNTGLCP